MYIAKNHMSKLHKIFCIGYVYYGFLSKNRFNPFGFFDIEHECDKRTDAQKDTAP